MTEGVKHKKAKRIPRGVSALRHASFRFFWSGQLVSVMGTWMQNTAQGWLVLQLTDSPFLLGLVSTVQFTPMLIFSLLAGVVADRVPKKQIMLITQTGMMVMAFMLGILTWMGYVKYWHVILLAGLFGTFNAFDVPARQSFVVEMVGKSDLMNAIALNSSIFTAARIIGPAAAGLIMGKIGIAACFILNGASFLAFILSLSFIKVNDVEKVEEITASVKERIIEGLNYIRKTPIILETMLLMAVMSTFTFNYQVIAPVLARDTLGQQAEGYGFLLSAAGVGSFIGAVFLALISHKGPMRKLVLGGAGGLCIFLLLLSQTTSYVVALILLGLVGMSMLIFSASVNSILQLTTPDNLRGRVMSVYTLVFGGMLPLGSFLTGSIAQVWDAPSAIMMGAGLGLIGLILTTTIVRYRKE